jgi:hypothetical protein
MQSEHKVLSFGLPDGRIELRQGELDKWAEHLTWCYQLAGVQTDATIGVVDFGTSPIAFLGSRLLMPTLEAGVAERLPGRIICLDASRERVALVPSILSRVALDVLVIREEMIPVLLSYCKEAGTTLDNLKIIRSFNFGLRRAPSDLMPLSGSRLLMIEETMLMAPQCVICGALHLRASHYMFDPTTNYVTTRDTSFQQELPKTLRANTKGCAEGKDDWLIPISTE